jgi:hypothetical protein
MLPTRISADCGGGTLGAWLGRDTWLALEGR